MDRGTGCLSLYPLPKIDEMFAKLKGARCFSTIDLRSGYYHIRLMRESRAKSAFVVPMGKWEFKQTPLGLIRANVREGPNHPVCKIVRASSKVLGRLWRPPKDKFIKKTLFSHSKERENSKRRVRSCGNYKTER